MGVGADRGKGQIGGRGQMGVWEDLGARWVQGSGG